MLQRWSWCEFQLWSSLEPNSWRLHRYRFLVVYHFWATQYVRVWADNYGKRLCFSLKGHYKTIPKVIWQCPCHFLWPHLDFLSACSSCHPHADPSIPSPNVSTRVLCVFHLLHSLNPSYPLYTPFRGASLVSTLTGVLWAELSWTENNKYVSFWCKSNCLPWCSTNMIRHDSGKKILKCCKEPMGRHWQTPSKNETR